MRNEEIIRHIKELRTFGSKPVNPENPIIETYSMPIALSFSVITNLRLLEEADKSYEETRNILIEKYAQHDDKNGIMFDDKGNPLFTKENVDIFEKEFTELLNLDSPVQISMVPYSTLKDVSLPISEADKVMFMISQDEPLSMKDM